MTEILYFAQPSAQIMAFIESSKLIQALERTPSGDKAG
jgi:hypothetical protein